MEFGIICTQCGKACANRELALTLASLFIIILTPELTGRKSEMCEVEVVLPTLPEESAVLLYA